MYKVIKIGGKDYKIEYTVEASLYDECTEKLIEFTGKVFSISDIENVTDGMTDAQAAEARKALIKNGISSITNIPSVATTLFYAGLLEYHGPEGDRSVLSISDAKKLIKQYFEEHKEDGTDNFYDLLQILMEQIGEDGFFKRIGLIQIFEKMSESEEPKQPKTPQDHKKKVSVKES